MRESVIEKKVSDYAKLLGWWTSKFTGTVGCPDRLFIRDSKVIFVEFKAPGKLPRPLQAKIIERMKIKGATVYVVDDIEQGKGIFNAY